MKRTKILGALFFAALTFAPRAGATEILTNTVSGWLHTTTGTSADWNTTFGSASDFSNSTGFNMSLGTFGPITVTGPDGPGYNLTKGVETGTNQAALVGAADGTGSVVLNAPTAGLTAFFLQLGINRNAAPITVTLSDGEVFTANPTIGTSVLLGLSSATPITSITLTTSSGSQIALVDFGAADSNQPPAPAAEVATALMIGSGLSLFGGFRKVFSNVSAARA